MAVILPDTAQTSQATTVKRICNRSFVIPQVREYGFTPSCDAHWLMLPPEFDIVLAEEPPHVAQVILEVMRQTIGRSGNGPHGRKAWAVVSSRSIAKKGLIHQPHAAIALQQAVGAGYLIRRKRGRGYEYKVRWRTCTCEHQCSNVP